MWHSGDAGKLGSRDLGLFFVVYSTVEHFSTLNKKKFQFKNNLETPFDTTLKIGKILDETSAITKNKVKNYQMFFIFLGSLIEFFRVALYQSA